MDKLCASDQYFSASLNKENGPVTNLTKQHRFQDMRHSEDQKLAADRKILHQTDDNTRAFYQSFKGQ